VLFVTVDVHFHVLECVGIKTYMDRLETNQQHHKAVGTVAGGEAVQLREYRREVQRGGLSRLLSAHQGP
jgi:hypothetical protein